MKPSSMQSCACSLDAGKSTTTLERARVIQQDLCQLSKRRDFRGLGPLEHCFESSPNLATGEVSKCKPARQGRGGARNSKSAVSYSISAPKIADLIAAECFAREIGLPFTRMITIHWKAAGAALADMRRATGRFLDLMSKAMGRHGIRTAWIWVHENGHGKGWHCHLLLHVPASFVPILKSLQMRWLRRITGNPYRKNVIYSKPIGGRLGLEKSNPTLWAINIEVALGYHLKGADPCAASEFGLERLEPGGRIMGKRCGSSQNIGTKARNMAKAGRASL